MDVRERARVKSDLRKCTSCGLYKTGNGPIPFSAPLDGSDIVVVGEAPGKVEDQMGSPLIGPSGTLAREWLAAAGLNPVDVGYMNVVSCWPNRTPHDREVKACASNVEKQFGLLKPKYVLVLGGVALTALCPVKTRISEARGYWWTVPPSLTPFSKTSVWAMATWHPSAVLRNRSLADQAIQDVMTFVWTAREEMTPTDAQFCMVCKRADAQTYKAGLPFCDGCALILAGRT